MPLHILEMDENEFVCKGTKEHEQYRWPFRVWQGVKTVEVQHSNKDVAFYGTIEELELYIAALKKICETSIQALKEETV